MKKTILTTTIALLLGVGTLQNAHADSEKIINPANQHSYQRFDMLKLWTQAKESCATQGGYLATITSEEENDWIKNQGLLGSHQYGVQLGASDSEIEGIWKWVTGEPFIYTNWHSGEPNNVNGGEHYLHLSGSPAKWNDFQSDGQTYATPMPYLCEWSEVNSVVSTKPVLVADTGTTGVCTSTKTAASVGIYGTVGLGGNIASTTTQVCKPIETVQISGQIKLGSQAGKGVSLLGDGLAESCLTDANGKFNCKITKGWTGFLTPESKGVSFSPPKISVTDAQTNLEVKTPLVGTTTDSFPLNGVMTSDWVKLKTDKATWQVETSTGASDDKTAYEGRLSFGSAKIGANQTAAIETTINVTQAGQLSFARRVSSNPEHGVLNFEISGKQKNGTWKTLITEKASGDVAWEMKNYALTVGQFKLRWTYAKDGAEAKGEDKAWIDAVSYPSSVKVAAKTCEGITAGTVKLMTIKNSTCDQLQAYRVWSKEVRPTQLITSQLLGGKITAVEAANEEWQDIISYIPTVIDGFKGKFIEVTAEVVFDKVCENVLTDHPIWQEVICGAGKDIVIAAIKVGLKGDIVTGVAPAHFELLIKDAIYLKYAGDLNEMTEEANNISIADYFLDEYYKAGANNAALKAMAKKYAAKDLKLSTLVDAIANQKGYYNGFSLSWSFYGDEYDNAKVVEMIQSTQTAISSRIKNVLK